MSLLARFELHFACLGLVGRVLGLLVKPFAGIFIGVNKLLRIMYLTTIMVKGVQKC